MKTWTILPGYTTQRYGPHRRQHLAARLPRAVLLVVLSAILLGLAAASPRGTTGAQITPDHALPGGLRGTGSTATWPPFVRIVPQTNSDDAMVYGEGIGDSFLWLAADFGSTSHNWSHTRLDYHEAEDSYAGLATEALSEPCSLPEGCLRISAVAASGFCDLQVNVPYEFSAQGPWAAPDLVLHRASLRFAARPFSDTVTHTVVILVPPRAPAPLPDGWQLVEGGLYVVESDGPDGQLSALLSVRYDPDLLDGYGVDPAELRIWRWVPAQRFWVMLESRVSVPQDRVSVPVDALTAYALAVPLRSHLWLPWVAR